MIEQPAAAGICLVCDPFDEPLGFTGTRSLCGGCAEFMRAEWAAFAFVCRVCGAELGVSYPEGGAYAAVCVDCGGGSLVAVFDGEPEGGYFTADMERVN